MFKRTLFVAVLNAALLGCQNPLMRPQSPEKEVERDAFRTKVETKLLGDYMSVHGNAPIVLQGVGLVTGLNGTGGDPPPSAARTELRDDMVRRGVENPETILRQKSTALVSVRAYLSPLAHKGQAMDVEVRLPGNSNATSLKGGWLMLTRLTEQQDVGGRVREGREYAVAEGPILISALDGEGESKAGQHKRGVVLGGGRSLTERHLTVVLRNDFRNVRNSKRIADRISSRFYHYNRYGNREPLAEGKTDAQIELKLHPRYKDNDWRYKQVVRNIAFRESAVSSRLRLQQLQKELMNPATANRAALQLEAIGRDAVPFLKAGLKGEALESRFHSAVALAYLGDEAGTSVLAEAARDEPAFRAYAFAALAVIQDSDALLSLRDLMHQESSETRYGAFRSLTVLDPGDSSLNVEDFGDGFRFYRVDSKATPMVHVTHRRKPEVVLFGKDQKFITPLALWAGRHIMIRADAGSDNVVISRYKVGEPEVREEISTSIADVIRRAVQLGASYPDIATMLMQANKQHNLPGRFEIDAMPQAGRVLKRLTTGTRRKIGNSSQLPSMFDQVSRPEDSKLESDVALPETPDDDRGRASVVDSRAEEAGVARPKRSFRERVARFFDRSGE